MKNPREIATRIRRVMGVHRLGALEGHAEDVDAALRENAHLDLLLEPRLRALEQTVVELAIRRLPGPPTSTDSPV